MTAEEIDKYINQIAFSGANDFLEKYKDDASAIIGHFGLGFYSAFMVADKVEILTRKAGEDKAWKWVSNGVDGFEITEAEKPVNGTEIKLFRFFSNIRRGQSQIFQLVASVRRVGNQLPQKNLFFRIQ